MILEFNISTTIAKQEYVAQNAKEKYSMLLKTIQLQNKKTRVEEATRKQAMKWQ